MKTLYLKASLKQPYTIQKLSPKFQTTFLLVNYFQAPNNHTDIKVQFEQRENRKSSLKCCIWMNIKVIWLHGFPDTRVMFLSHCRRMMCSEVPSSLWQVLVPSHLYIFVIMPLGVSTNTPLLVWFTCTCL